MGDAQDLTAGSDGLPPRPTGHAGSHGSGVSEDHQGNRLHSPECRVGPGSSSRCPVLGRHHQQRHRHGTRDDGSTGWHGRPVSLAGRDCRGRRGALGQTSGLWQADPRQGNCGRVGFLPGWCRSRRPLSVRPVGPLIRRRKGRRPPRVRQERSTERGTQHLGRRVSLWQSRPKRRRGG